MSKKCLPCLVHGEYHTLKQVVKPLIKKRMAAEKIANSKSGDRQFDRMYDKAWDTFYDDLGRLKIQCIGLDDLDDLDLDNGIFEFYFESEFVYMRKRRA